MAQKRNIFILRMFFAVFFAAFSWLFFCSIFLNKLYTYSSFASLFLAFAFIGLFLLVFYYLNKYSAFCKKHGNIICLAALLLCAALQLKNGLAMRYATAYDLYHIYAGGMVWQQQGAAFAQNQNFMPYFHMFPSSLGAAFLFKCWFGLAQLLFIRDYYVAALLLNVLLLQCCVALVYASLRSLLGAAAGLWAVFAFLVFFPFYMLGAVFYTDALSAVFPIACFYLYHRALQGRGLGKMLLFLGAGAAAGLGCIIKITPIIMLAAVVLAHIFSLRRAKKGRFFVQQLLPVLAMCFAAGLLVLSFNIFVSGRLLNPQEVEKRAMPLSHWVAMGLWNDGGYDEGDYARAMALPSRSARVLENRSIIRARLSQPSVLDLAKLFTRKGLRCFGSGSYDLAVFLDDGPYQRAPAHEWVLPDGKYHTLYSHLAQGAYLALFFSMLFCAGQSVLSVKMGLGALRSPAAFIAMLGLLLFLLFWETNSRYTLNFFPVLVLCAGQCMPVLLRALRRRCRRAGL